MNRIVAFILPCIRGGVIAWRSETWLMFQATPKKPAMNPDTATAQKIRASGASTRGRPERLNPIAVSTSIRPTPRRLVAAPVVKAARRNPSDPIENAIPIAAGPRSRSRAR